MRRLWVRYHEDDGSVAQRTMIGFVPFGDDHCSALVPDEGYMHPMSYDCIVDACDTDTGEIISVRELCGARPLPGALVELPARMTRPKGKKRVAEVRFLKAQRRQDSEIFQFRYRHGAIWNHFRNKLISLFNGRCFACGAPDGLQLDHHVPFSTGGRREPGNIVMLCYKCNAQKWDYLPEQYYSADELSTLAPLLARETAILSFLFEDERWDADPCCYLREIGLGPLLVDELATNPDHDWTLQRGGSATRVVLTCA